MPDAQSTGRDLHPDNLAEIGKTVEVPTYDRGDLPGGIVHLGVGGFHRAHQARYLDELLEMGEDDWSIVGAGVMPGDAPVRDAAAAQECLYTLIERDGNGESARVIGSIGEYVFGVDDPDGLIERMADPSTRIVSLTITEAGYPIDEQTQDFDPGDRVVAGDLADTDSVPTGAVGMIVAALARRRERGTPAFTVQSCDNVVNNGDVARASVVGMSRAWSGDDLAEWIADGGAFPNSMVDRITPAASPATAEWLAEEHGLIDRWPIAAEPFRQWVIEDDFALGRPPWEKVGALLTDDVRPYELIKIRLLNAGHSAIAYLGAMAGHLLIDEVMADRVISDFYVALMDREITPTLPTVRGVDLTEYKATLVQRFSNPTIGDQVARVCLDGSSKQPKFTVPIVADQLAAGREVSLLALSLAGWCHYLSSTRDERGAPIVHAADPYLEEAMRHAHASLSDPAAFLDFDFVFGREIPENAAFRGAFSGWLESLRSRGVHATLADV